MLHMYTQVLAGKSIVLCTTANKNVCTNGLQNNISRFSLTIKGLDLMIQGPELMTTGPNLTKRGDGDFCWKKETKHETF